MTVLAHVSDVHLGARLRGLPDYPGCPSIDPVESAYDSFRALISSILSGGFDGVLISGDLFDRAVSDRRALDAAHEAFAALTDAHLPVAFILGNHDVQSPLSPELRLPDGVWLAPGDRPETQLWPHLGVAVHGQSIVDPDEPRDLSLDYPDPVTGMRNIGLLHTSLDGRRSKRALAPTTAERLDRRGYDYWALGHVHHRVVGSDAPRMAYPGSVHAARRAETGPHGYLRVDLRGAIPQLTPVHTATVVREVLTAGDLGDVERALGEYRRPDHHPVVIWTLDGPAELLAAARDIAGRSAGYAVDMAQ